jgi:hypothetical protein
MLLYTIGCFLGPDIGCTLDFICKTFGAEEMGKFFMKYIHNIYYYPTFVALLVAYLYKILSSYQINKTGTFLYVLPKLSISKGKSLSYYQSWLLCVAGGLSHYFLDVVFELNGRDDFYLWILRTGHWKDVKIELLAVVVTGFFTCLLIGGICYMQNSDWPFQCLESNFSVTENLVLQEKKSFFLFLFVFFPYLLYLYCANNGILIEKFQAVGEEADLGVLTFLFITFFLPLFLCNRSLSVPVNVIYTLF